MSFDDSFSSRVAIARGSLGLTQTELAKRVGIVPRQIAAYEGGEARPRLKVLQNLAAALGTTTEWLAQGVGNGPDVSNVKRTVTVAEIPVYSSVQASLLDGGVDLANSSVSDFIPCPPNAGEQSFAITIEGDSMTCGGLVSFPDGTIVTIDPGQPVENGDFGLFMLLDSNESTFKQLIIDQGKKFLKGLNPLWPLVPVQDNLKVIGRAVHAQRYLQQLPHSQPAVTPNDTLSERMDRIEKMLESIVEETLNKKPT